MTITTLAAALVRAQREIKTISKDSTNPHFKNKYASLDAIIEAARPILNAHGFAVIQGVTAPDRDESGRVTAFTVTTTLLHESGESVERGVVVPLAKADAQGAGGALTYGRRYGLSALLCLATDEDDDAHRASQPAERPASGDRYPRSEAVRLMPFGKTKGVPLTEHTGEQLAKTLAWCQETDATKFKKLIAAIEEVLEARRDGEPLNPALADAVSGTESDNLPFA